VEHFITFFIRLYNSIRYGQKRLLVYSFEKIEPRDFRLHIKLASMHPCDHIRPIRKTFTAPRDCIICTTATTLDHHTGLHSVSQNLAPTRHKASLEREK
jgi:hypothetical protein